MNQKMSVVVVGRKPPSHENLSVSYLMAALQSNGIDAKNLPLNQFDNISSLAVEIMRINPTSVGLSITDATCALLMLTLGEMLSKKGYLGHITCGGGYATLQREWLLERHSWLHSVVRLDGEVVLPQLVKIAHRGGDVACVPGVTTRKGDGLPALVQSNIPMSIWPAREELPKLLDHRAASIIASRGCTGSCEYCGPSALQDLERHEAQQQNAPYPCKNGRIRRRTVEDLTDEMAYLYHQKDVRYFAFADEQLLPPGPKAARNFLKEFRQKLQKKKVLQYGFSGQLGGHQISSELCVDLKESGMVRAHLGIDLAGDGKVFSRPNLASKQIEAMRRLNGSGIPTISNILLLHPYSTLDSLEGTLEEVSQLTSGYVEFGQMLAFAGTRLSQKLEVEGRLSGNPLRYHYRFNDMKMSRFERVFGTLRTHGFGRYSIMYRAHEVACQMALAKRLGKRTSQQDFDGLQRICNGAFQLALQAYGQAIDICRNNVDIDEKEFVNIYRMGQLLLEKELQSVESRFHDRIQYSPAPVSAFTVNAVSVMALVAFAGAPGCQTDSSNADDTETQTDTSEEKTDTVTANKDSTTLGDTDTATDIDTTPLLPQCESYSEEETVAAATIKQVALATDKCLCSGLLPNGKGLNWSCLYDLSPHLYPRDAAVREATIQNVVQALQQSDLTCLPRHVDINGESRQEFEQLYQTIWSNCDSRYYDNGFHPYATVDDNGAARMANEMLENSVLTQEEFDCANQVLQGLSFPCLAGMDIATGVIIIE